MPTLSNVKTRGGEANPPCVRLAPDAYPEAKSTKTGESVRYVPDPAKKWYVFRATCGRECKASDFLVEDGTYTYIAQKYVEKFFRGKRRRFLQTLIPNLVFAYTTEEKAKEYVTCTPALSYLSYYYNHFEEDADKKNPPLTIPVKEMERYIKATCTKNQHMLFVDPSQVHYKSGDNVRVIDGPFIGVEGKVARISGQQRVVISLPKIGCISTAYIPTAFIQLIDTDQ